MDNLPVEYQEFWKKWNVFDGKSTVREFWMACLINIVIGIIIGIIARLIGLGIITSLWGLAVIVPNWAVMIRRFHDTGRSGWNSLWVFLPIPGWIILIIFLIQESK